jgi:WD40 repeat protein
LIRFPPGKGFPILIWAIDSGELQAVLTEHREPVRNIAFLPDGKSLISAAADGVVKWNLSDQSGDRRAYSQITGTAISSRTGNELVNISSLGNVSSWIANGATNLRPLMPNEDDKAFLTKASSDPVMAICEKWAAVGREYFGDRFLVWGLRDANVLATLPYRTHVAQLQFIDSDRYLIGSGYYMVDEKVRKGSVEIWETNKWRHLFTIITESYRAYPVVVSESTILVVECRLPVGATRKSEFQTIINAYSLETGKVVASFDTKAPIDDYACSALYLESHDAIAIGSLRGKVSFYSRIDVLKTKKR